VVVAMACGAEHPICPAYVPSVVARPFVWRVSGPHGALVIQATHQGAGPDDVSSAAWAAFQEARLFVGEAEEAIAHEPADADRHQPLFELEPGDSLRRLLPNGEFEQLREYVGISPRELSRLKPWVAFMLLGRSQIQFAEITINAELLGRARMRSLRVIFLDTWDDQMAYLDAAITPAKLSVAIRNAPKLSCQLGHRLAAFRAGDDAAFVNDIVPGEPVVARIERWYARLRDIAEYPQVSFAALGIGQLLGPYGILARFAADGYAVERL